MTMLSRFALGTVQFGSNYGVSNRTGQPSESETAKILEGAAEAGIGYIDTASAYGEAETLIGRYWPPGKPVRIVCKAPAIQDAEIEARHGTHWLDDIARSLDRLKRNRIHAVLVHRATDLRKPGWQYLVDALRAMRERNWTTSIGASVYDDAQLALVESRFSPQLVQLPFNALDRRMAASGAIARLKHAGTEVHARSIFLQGLLLMTPETLPIYFAPLRAQITKLHRRWAEHGLAPLEGSLGCALAEGDIDAIVVGVNRRVEFDEIAAAVAKLKGIAVERGPAAAIDASLLDPSRWPNFPQ
jgi:aryl-alcohol dehydrogenase-like predicted oxidoreductase